MAKKILVALTLALLIAPTKSQSKTANNSNKAEHHDSPAQPIIVNVIGPKATDQEAANKKVEDQLDMSIKRSNLRLTVFIALAAVVQAGFAILQWRVYRDQHRTMVDTLAETKKSADAAKDNADALMKSYRPLVIVDWENLVHLSPQPTPLLRHHFNWGMRNVGNIPGFVIETFVRFILIESIDSLPPQPVYGAPVPYAGEPLLSEPKPVPGNLVNFKRIEDKSDYESIEARYRSGDEHLFAFGFVRYQDPYGKPHETRFGLLYHAEETPRMGLDGFSLGGPSSYNKYT